MTKDVKIIRPTIDGLDTQKIRVAAYCRVSTDSADQVNSFIAQVKYYNDFIRISKDLVLVDIYADEGITGTCTAKRTEFKRMLNDSRLGKIDRIYVKSVSRFARNSLECIENIRLLKSYGTTVLFENDGIDTENMNSEMILYIKSAFAQSEALAGSKRVSTAARMKMETGEFYTTSTPFGYKIIDRKLVPLEDEVGIVRKIFNDYLHGAGIGKIVIELNKTRAPGYPWNKSRVRYILGNEKYIGDTMFQKTYTPQVFPLRNKINRGEVEKYYAFNTHEGIVEREIFEKVKEMLEQYASKRDINNNPKRTSFSGKIYCGDCGWTYKKKHCKSGNTWCCAHDGVAGQHCNSSPITEEAIKNTFVVFFNKLKQNSDSLIKEPLSMLIDIKKRILNGSNAITEIDDEISELAEQNSMYVQFHSNNIIDDVTYLEETNKIKKRLNTLRSRRIKLLNEDDEEKCIDELRKIKATVDEAPEAIIQYDDKLFFKIIQRVNVISHDEIEFVLLCGMKFRERTVWN